MVADGSVTAAIDWILFIPVALIALCCGLSLALRLLGRRRHEGTRDEW